MCILFCAFINFVSFHLDQEMENVLYGKHFVFLLKKFFEFSVLVQGVQKLDQLKRFISKTLSFYQTYQENIMLIIFFNARVDLSS